MSQTQMLMAAVTALVTVIGVLWREMLRKNKDTDAELREQKEINKETNERVINLTEKVGHATGYKDGVDDIAAALISEIRGEK